MKRKQKLALGFVLTFLVFFCVLMCNGISANAATTSQNNIKARANYLYDSTWVCQKTVAGWRGQYYFYAGNTYRMPYGQPVHAGRYIGYFVSVDDYQTATKNPNSVFYNSRSNCSGMDSVYYATDCSAFVSWCWGISRQTTATIPSYSSYMGMANSTNVYNLQLGDCLNSNYVGHVVLVTGLTYNSNGVLTQIEITEQTPPQLKRSYYTPAQLANKYGANYGIYRYYGSVPSAPNSYSSGSTEAVNNITTKYFPKCDTSYTSLYPALNSIGVNCDWALHCEIAELNGITDFVGTVAQNAELLNLLKAGTLLNPNYIDTTKYYPACTSGYTSFYPAMESIGVSCDWELHCAIAEANGITDFVGTVAQNTELLNLLKQGKLLRPANSSSEEKIEYYPACTSGYTSFYPAMESIGVSCDWELHCAIAETNGITDFVGTVAQNTELLNLLKAGKLIVPKGEEAPEKIEYYPACTSGYTSFYPAMESIGVSCDWELHCAIAEANGITDFVGTVAQNTELLNLLKAGKLIVPKGEEAPEKIEYYPACTSGYTSFYPAMESIGVSCDWELHCAIAEANGIIDFVGTVAQNTELLNLLKAGKLIKPSNVSSSGTGTIVSGANGYERGYRGGMPGDGVIYAHGLDLSSWQGSNLNFQNIKNAGYTYVILRAGTTYGKDSCFETYYQRAKAAGLNVGAYYYSYATTTAAAQTDANNMISWLSGKKFEYPIYFDYEDPSQDYLSQTASKNICLTFMDALANKGYLVGLYTGYYKSTQLLMSQICARYEFWVAYYYDNTYTSLGSSFCKKYGMYQYTCTKYVNGAGPFDANVCYKDYPSIVKKYGFNGY